MTIGIQHKELDEVKKKLNDAHGEIDKLREIIVKLEQQKRFILYDDWKLGGILDDYVKDLTFFPDFPFCS